MFFFRDYLRILSQVMSSLHLLNVYATIQHRDFVEPMT